MDQMSVSEMLPSGSAGDIINETVFAAGWDTNFIIAKQHPKDANQHVDKTVTNYYILRVADGSLTGPLQESAFIEARKRISVPSSLDFSLVFDELK